MVKHLGRVHLGYILYTSHTSLKPVEYYVMVQTIFVRKSLTLRDKTSEGKQMLMVVRGQNLEEENQTICIPLKGGYIFIMFYY